MRQKGDGLRPSLLGGATLACIAAAIISGLLFYFMYWQYRGLFNEQGRYFDGTTVHHDQTFVLIVPTLVFLSVALVLGQLWRVRSRS